MKWILTLAVVAPLFFLLPLSWNSESLPQREEAVSLQGGDLRLAELILGDTTEVWKRVFATSMLQYEPPDLADLDLERLNELDSDYDKTYVIAHEVGHHIQNILEIRKNFEGLWARSEESGRERLALRLELEADCLAGVWAFHSKLFLPPTVNELRNLYRRLERADPFSRGAPAPRTSAFLRGSSRGNPQDCLNSFPFH